jgi:hypothetical protein
MADQRIQRAFSSTDAIICTPRPARNSSVRIMQIPVESRNDALLGIQGPERLEIRMQLRWSIAQGKRYKLVQDKFPWLLCCRRCHYLLKFNRPQMKCFLAECPGSNISNKQCAIPRKPDIWRPMGIPFINCQLSRSKRTKYKKRS